MNLDVNSIIKKAAEAAKNAPEHLQEVAFNKAFDVLMGNMPSGNEIKSPTKVIKKKVASSKKENSESNLDALDRTAHAEIHHNKSCLQNSLRLLKAAKDDLDIDGLTSSIIAKVLVNKFRCTVTPQAVGQNLNAAGRYVNRRKKGSTVIFSIMGPGEDFLEQDDVETKATASRKKSSSPKKRFELLDLQNELHRKKNPLKKGKLDHLLQ